MFEVLKTSCGVCNNVLLTIVTFGGFELIKDPVGLPPPMVLRLSEFRFPVMTVQVRPVSVHTLKSFGPEKNQIKVIIDKNTKKIH